MDNHRNRTKWTLKWGNGKIDQMLKAVINLDTRQGTIDRAWKGRMPSKVFTASGSKDAFLVCLPVKVLDTEAISSIISKTVARKLELLITSGRMQVRQLAEHKIL